MLSIRKIKTILLIIFIALLACKYFDLIPNYHIFKNLYLFDLRHLIVLIYILININQYRKMKNNEKA